MSEILYFIQISCTFVGKSATFQFFRATVPLTRTICSPLSVQKAASPLLSHPSIRVLFFSISQAKPPAAPLSGTVNARKKVLRVVIGRFAGQEYNFAVSWEYMALFCAL